MPYLVLLGQGFSKNILLYLNSAPSNLSNCKILRGNKNAKVWDQKCLIRYFARIL